MSKYNKEMPIPKKHKKEKLSSVLEHLAAEFIAREANRSPLVTVTGSRLSDSGRHIDILISVLPEHQEEAAIDFLTRHKKDFAKFVEERARVGRMPGFDFLVDTGEKNRRRVEDII